MATIAELKARGRKLARTIKRQQKVVTAAQKRINAAKAAKVAADTQLAALRNPPVQTAVKWALGHAGRTGEQPAGSNAGPYISDWIRASGGVPGQPWCQYFANAVLVHGGGPQLKSGYTVGVVQWATQGAYGLKRVSWAERRIGDFVYFKFPGVSHEFCDHVGVLSQVKSGVAVCVEGNTSSGTSGSQNNGGGVYIRERPSTLVAAVVRPTYGRT